MIERGQQSVRLTVKELDGILRATEAVSKALGFEWICISLFGSRTQMDALGGDLDLYFRIKSADRHDIYAIKSQLRIALKDELGDQKIDVIVDDLTHHEDAFLRHLDQVKVDLWIKK